MPFTKEQLEGFLKAGKISPQQYQAGLQNTAPSPVVPVMAVAPVGTLDNAHASPPPPNPGFDIRSQSTAVAAPTPDPMVVPQGWTPASPLEAALEASNGRKSVQAPAQPQGTYLDAVQEVAPQVRALQAAPKPVPDFITNAPAYVDPNIPKPAPRPAAGPAQPTLVDPRGDMVAHQQAGLDAQGKVLQQGLDLLGQKQVEMADAEKANRDALEQADVLAKAQKQEDDEKINLAVKARSQAIDDYNSSSIDPDKIWKDKGDLARVVAALAVAAGAFGQAYSRGTMPNTAKQIIDDMVNRDISAQERNLDKKGKMIDIAGNSLAIQRQLSGDNRSAEYAERARLIDNYKTGLNGLLARYDSESMKNAIQMTSAKLESDKQQLFDAWKVTQYQEEKQRRAQAASAQAAAAERQFQHNLDYAKLNLDKYKADQDDATKRATSAGKKTELPPSESMGLVKTEFNRLISSPEVENFGLGAKIAGKFGQYAAPDAAITAVRANQLNMNSLALAGHVLKDTEGRIPQSFTDELHKTDVEVGDTPAIVKAKLNARLETTQSLYRTLGGVSPAASVPTTEAPGK